MLQYFFLTRFNLELWDVNKHRMVMDKEKWMEERCELFEKYCLPSVAGQTDQDFTWIILCDHATEDCYQKKLIGYRKKCPQIQLIQVRCTFSWDYADIFADVIRHTVCRRGFNPLDVCITTMLDNDDAIHHKFVEYTKRRAKFLDFGTFLSYDYGLQYFNELNMATRIWYPNNHFLSYVESVKRVRTCYGFGSHFLLEKQEGVKVCHIDSETFPMWVETIHENNVDNDVKMTTRTTFVRRPSYLKKYFNIDQELCFNRNKFLVRFVFQMIRRMYEKIYPREWK